MPIRYLSQARTGLLFSGAIPNGYNEGVKNPRERARLRLLRFFRRDEAPTQAEFAARFGHQQSWVSKMLVHGPLLQDLDEIASAMGISVAELVAPLGDDADAVTEVARQRHRAMPGLAARVAALERIVLSSRKNH